MNSRSRAAKFESPEVMRFLFLNVRLVFRHSPRRDITALVTDRKRRFGAADCGQGGSVHPWEQL
jgi:hypothetical protein